MEKTTLRIPNISCGHCVASILTELREMEGILKVDGDPNKKELTVEWESPATLEMIRGALKEINYPAE